VIGFNVFTLDHPLEIDRDPGLNVPEYMTAMWVHVTPKLVLCKLKGSERSPERMSSFFFVLNQTAI